MEPRRISIIGTDGNETPCRSPLPRLKPHKNPARFLSGGASPVNGVISPLTPRSHSPLPQSRGSHITVSDTPSVLELLDLTRQTYEQENSNARRSYQEAIAKLRDEIGALQGILSSVGLHASASVQREEEISASLSQSLGQSLSRLAAEDAGVEQCKKDPLPTADIVKPRQLEEKPPPPELTKPQELDIATAVAKFENDSLESPFNTCRELEILPNQPLPVVPAAPVQEVKKATLDPRRGSMLQVEKFKQARIRTAGTPLSKSASMEEEDEFDESDLPVSRIGSGASNEDEFDAYTSEHRFSIGSDDGSGPHLKLQVLNTWMKDESDAGHIKHGSMQKQVFDQKPSLSFKFRGKSGSNVFVSERSEAKGFDSIVLNPNSGCLVAWSLLGFVFILFDLVVIPFQVFNPPVSTAFRACEMSVTVFWTLDVMVNFFTGYTKVNGVNEVRLRFTAWNYVRSWFLPDAFLVTIDWVVFLSEVMTDNMGLLRVGKLARLSKTIRVVRLFRLAKVDGFWGQITKRFNSEELATLLGLAGRFLGVIICCHWVGCAWYGITMIQGDAVETWMKFHQPTDLGITYRYFTAMHWAMTQFTPASMEVYPHNSTERILNVMVLMLGLLTFTSLISSISNAMSHLQNMNNVNFLRQQHLRKWMGENKVSMQLVTSVWACVKNSKQHTQRTPQKDVELLKVLPKHILAQLCEEVLQPVFETHPFFSSYLLYNPTSMRRLCSAAIQETYLYERDELFNCGDTAERAYFVRTGRLVYESMPEQKAGIARGSDARTYAQLMRTTTRHMDGPLLSGHMSPATLMSPTLSTSTAADSRKNSSNTTQLFVDLNDVHYIDEGNWLSEVALWTEWTHCGPLFATFDSELVAIESRTFCTTMGKYVVQDVMLRRYAVLFALRAVHQLRLLDIWFEPEILEDLAWCSFFDDRDLTEGLPSSTNRSSEEERLLQIPPAVPTNQQSVERQLHRWHDRVHNLREEDEAEEDEPAWGFRSLFRNSDGGGKRPSTRNSYNAKEIRRSSQKKSLSRATQQSTRATTQSRATKQGSRENSFAERRSA